MELQQLDAFADSEWHAVQQTQLAEPDSDKAPAFLAGASILKKTNGRNSLKSSDSRSSS
jgi:hypothetical protein